MGALSKLPGMGVARSTVKDGLALINQPLDALADVLRTVEQCNLQIQQTDRQTGIPLMPSVAGCRLDQIRPVYGKLLAGFAKAAADTDKLRQIFILPITTSQPLAIRMLSVLYGTMTKRRTDEADENAEMMLMTCANMFNPASDIIGETMGLWQRISKHPLILATAIHTLINAQKWTPSPSELREQMRLVQERLSMKLAWADRWLDWMRQADRLLFEKDRPAWDAAHARVGADVVRAMRPEDEAPDQDDDGNTIAPSPYWQALDDLAKAKLIAEQTSLRMAACKVKPARKTKKLKQGGKINDA